MDQKFKSAINFGPVINACFILILMCQYILKEERSIVLENEFMMSGFAKNEFEARLSKAQTLMGQKNLDALFLTTEPEIRYFTGYLTRFWESPSRPWFLIVPQSGKPIAVIPSIGAALMASTWISDIRTWSSPDLIDDGVTLLAETLTEVLGAKGRIGVPSGHETHLRMPLSDFGRLKSFIPNLKFLDDSDIIRSLRLIKSEVEIKKIKMACNIAGKSFERVGEIAKEGTSMDAIFRDFQGICLSEGADCVPYLAGGRGALGYDDVISPANTEPLEAGDILMLDTGLVYDGYFCDFDRNYSVGSCDPRSEEAYKRLLEAVEAGKEAAKPGNTAQDVFEAMDQIVTGGTGVGEVGRLGHGLGMQLTEWPSFIKGDLTELKEGMVLTLEPGIEIPGGGLIVHEDNFVVREGAPEQISPRAPTSIWEI